MNKPDIELPPLPPLHIAPSVDPVDYPDVAQALMDYARAAIEADRKRTAKQLAAYKSLVEALEAKSSHLRKMYEELKASTNPDLLTSERAANAILTEELESYRKRRGDADHDLHLAWCNVALGLATDYAEAYCNMQCDDSEDHLHEMLRARRELQQHLYNQPASMGPPGDPEDEKENPHD